MTHTTPQVALRISQLVERYNISKPTIYRLIKNNQFPKAKKLGNCSVWFKQDLQAFEDQLELVGTADSLAQVKA